MAVTASRTSIPPVIAVRGLSILASWCANTKTARYIKLYTSISNIKNTIVCPPHVIYHKNSITVDNFFQGNKPSLVKLIKLS